MRIQFRPHDWTDIGVRTLDVADAAAEAARPQFTGEYVRAIEDLQDEIASLRVFVGDLVGALVDAEALDKDRLLDLLGDRFSVVKD